MKYRLNPFYPEYSYAVFLLLAVACIPGCNDDTPNASSSSSIPESAEIDKDRLPELQTATNKSRLVADLRPALMKQIYGLSDEAISSAEQALLRHGVDRQYNITRSFVGGTQHV